LKSSVLSGNTQIKDVPNNSIPYSLLDLDGSGKKQKIELAFPYYHPKPDDKLSIIYQGGYKVYDTEVNKNDIPVIGMLHPCIGVVVTDGLKVIAFHKHFSNSLNSLIDIIKKHINLEDPNKVWARLYTVKNDKLWSEKFIFAHNNKASVIDELKSIKDFLATIIDRKNIVAQAYNLLNQKGEPKYPDFSLGLYDCAELYVAVQVRNLFEKSDGTKKIKFYNIDPFQEDALGYKGKQIPIQSYLGIQTYEDQIKEGTKLPEYVGYDEFNRYILVRQRNGFLESQYDSNGKDYYDRHFKSKNFRDQKIGGVYGYNSLEFFDLK